MFTLKGRLCRPFFYLILFVMPCIGDTQNHRQLNFHFESTSYSEVSSLYSVSNQWKDRVTSGNDVWSSSRLTIGYQHKNFILQSISRADIHYKFANETAQFLQLTKNHRELEVGKNYLLSIYPENLSATGLRFGFKTDINNNLEFTALFSLLQPTDLLQGRLDGNTTVIQSNDYDFNFSSDLMYENDPLFDRATENISGNGYAVDLKLFYRVTDNWSLNLDLMDIMGEISFENIPYTVAEATSDVKNFDDEGYVIYAPVISGIESTKNYRHQLELQSKLSINYQLSAGHSINYQHHSLMGLNIDKFIYAQRISTNQLNWFLIPEFQAVGFSFRHPNFSIGLETDNIDVKKMKYLSLNTHLFWTF